MHGDSDLLLLPVTIRNRIYNFVVDTGSSHTIYDASLRPLLGQQVRSAKALMLGDDSMEVKLFSPPEARLGSLLVRGAQYVVALSLQSNREITGQPIYGVLGMDFLASHIVQVDYDRRMFRILDSLPSDAGTPVSLTYKHGVPYVAVQLDDEHSEDMLLDSGLSGTGGLLGRRLFDAMATTGVLGNVCDAEIGNGVHDNIAVAEGTLQSIVIADIRVPQVRVMGLGNGHSNLGASFLARFNVVFDFPAASMYLKKSHVFSKADRPSLSGLTLRRAEGGVLIETVKKGSAGDKAGIRANDFLVTIAGATVDGMSIYAIKKAFVDEGRTVTVTVRRAKTTFACCLHLRAPAYYPQVLK